MNDKALQLVLAGLRPSGVVVATRPADYTSVCSTISNTSSTSIQRCGAFKLGVPEQQLNRPEISRPADGRLSTRCHLLVGQRSRRSRISLTGQERAFSRPGPDRRQPLRLSE